MSYRLQVRVQAKRDLRQAAKWYEQRLSGLGREFVSEIEAVIERIEQNPLLYQPIYREVREQLRIDFRTAFSTGSTSKTSLFLQLRTYIVMSRRGRIAFKRIGSRRTFIEENRISFRSVAGIGFF